MSILTARTIDIHAHAVLEQTFGHMGALGPELSDGPDGRPKFRVGAYELNGVRYRGSPFMDVSARIAAMDRAGIDFQIVSPNPLTYFHFAPAADARHFCRYHNDILAEVVAPHRGRLAAFAQVPIQDPLAACEELERAVSDLHMLGAYIGTDFPFMLDDPALDPFYETCVRLNVPLFIHPGPAGIDGPPGDERLKRFELEIMAGFAGQETLAVAILIFGGVLDRHPNLDICISHGGGAAMYLWGRLAHATRKRPWASDALKADGAFEERAQRLWYDVHVHDLRALDLLLERVGPNRLVYGTNFAGWDQPEHVTQIHIDAPLAENARRLLRADHFAVS
jgi:aminocarboxymuconate-semialdehyde decarboxylase